MKIMTAIATLGTIVTAISLSLVSIFRGRMKRLAAQNNIYQDNIKDLTNHVEISKEVDDLKRSDLAEFVHRDKDSN